MVVKGADSFQLVSAATGKYLNSTSSNNGIRQGTGENRDWVVDTESGYLKNVALSRYVGCLLYTSAQGGVVGDLSGRKAAVGGGDPQAVRRVQIGIGQGQLLDGACAARCV